MAPTRNSHNLDQDPIRSIARTTAVVFFTVAILAGLLYFLALIHLVLLELAGAMVVALALEPLVRRIEGKRVTRTWASVIALVSVVIVIAAFIGAIASPFISQGTNLVHNAPQIIGSISHNAEVAELDSKLHFISKVQDWFAHLPAVSVIGSVLGGASELVILLIIAFFILIDGPGAWERFLKLLKPVYAKRIDKVGQKMARAVSGFVSGNLFISLIAGTVGLITFEILRVPYPVALAGLIALLDLIPLVGTAIAAIAVAAVALSKSVAIAIIAVVVILVYQFTENHFIQPAVYSRAIALSPLLVILATITGAILGGIVGILLSIPLAAVLQIAAVEVISPEEIKE